jgi:hypothetical protein
LDLGGIQTQQNLDPGWTRFEAAQTWLDDRRIEPLAVIRSFAK